MGFKLITAAQASEILSVHQDTLKKWRSQDKGPRYMAVGRQIRYEEKDVTAFARSRKTKQKKQTK